MLSNLPAIKEDGNLVKGIKQLVDCSDSTKEIPREHPSPSREQPSPQRAVQSAEIGKGERKNVIKPIEAAPGTFEL
jgi:hypothetical protein